MDARIINAIGITLTTIGTVFTLWTILQTNPQKVGTWDELEGRHEEFPKEQRRARIGYILIVLGGLLQILGQFL